MAAEEYPEVYGDIVPKDITSLEQLDIEDNELEELINNSSTSKIQVIDQVIRYKDASKYETPIDALFFNTDLDNTIVIKSVKISKREDNDWVEIIEKKEDEIYIDLWGNKIDNFS